MSATDDTGGAAAPPSIWDPVVRLSHWGIATVVLLNAVVTEGGSVIHIWIGWVGLALLAIRLLWGFVGPREARFASFPPNPAGALSHLRDLVSWRPKHYASHNPAGALMAYALWATLAVLIGTGIAMTGAGPWAATERATALETDDWSTLELGESGEEDGEVLQEIHEIAGNLILLLAVLHVTGVVVESSALGRNLVRPMLTGGARRNE